MPKRLVLELPQRSREAKLDKMLTHYNDARETLFSKTGRGAGEGGRCEMPSVWNDSYKELERCLKRMRELAEDAGAASPVFRSWYWNVCGWYLRSQKRRVPLIRRDKRGRDYHVVTGAGPQFVMVVEGEDALSARMVVMGLGWISAEFAGEIYEPAELHPMGCKCKDCKKAA